MRPRSPFNSSSMPPSLPHYRDNLIIFLFFHLQRSAGAASQTKVQVLGSLNFIKGLTRNLLPWSHGRLEQRRRTPAGRRQPARGDWLAAAPSCCGDPVFVGAATLMSCMDETQQMPGSEELRCQTTAVAGSCHTRWNCFLKCDRFILRG